MAAVDVDARERIHEGHPAVAREIGDGDRIRRDSLCLWVGFAVMAISTACILQAVSSAAPAQVELDTISGRHIIAAYAALLLGVAAVWLAAAGRRAPFAAVAVLAALGVGLLVTFTDYAGDSVAAPDWLNLQANSTCSSQLCPGYYDLLCHRAPCHRHHHFAGDLIPF